MLSPIGTSIPHICISPASPEKVSPEPYCLFLSADPDQDDSGYRQKLLSPQCHFPNMFPRHPSPLRPADCPPPKGLHRDQFDLLLKVSRDKRAALSSRKVPDLRKELAIKNQRNKQLERRALFLSRIQEPPSSTAVPTPKIPVEFSAVNHCTLPPGGLESPLAFFNSLAGGLNGQTGKDLARRRTWFEQVDCRLPISKPKTDLKLGSRKLPSLEDIIARVRPVLPPPSMANDPIFATPRPSMFLRSGKNASSTRSVSDTNPHINIGRLHMPVRRRQSSDSLPDMLLNVTPRSPCCPNIEITTTAPPRTRSNAKYAFTEYNVHALGRANTAREMMTTIKRRTSPPPLDLADNQLRPKRHSAPAEMQLRERSGFEASKLVIAWGFLNTWTFWTSLWYCRAVAFMDSFLDLVFSLV
ncbi:uncharacterized protein EDB91DRAFT_1233875 [Suillus paluster]|uniref:uncharacterized protein n=1 Tax=Suillus paluster TaxID=48578 RepID=UPI001B862F08|nr:uncharacterized protein EDB91DRAFT_1233875 [Suillus paluster]KAG1755082.1 hypothetical protein EDB91DRAFT_1233875 [Suillus paluster]